MELKKICLLGGVHGDDRIGVEVLTHYFQQPHEQLQLLLGNYKALEEGKKYIDDDMLQAGKGEVTCTTSVETCRAGEIHEILISHEYVIDVHGSQVQDDCIIIFDTSPETLRLAQGFGIPSIVQVTPTNDLLASVKHPVTVIKKVQVKQAPTKSEVEEVIFAIESAVRALENNAPVEGQVSIQTKASISEIIEQGVI